jgi:hypothetical protein
MALLSLRIDFWMARGETSLLNTEDTAQGDGLNKSGSVPFIAGKFSK